MKEIRQLRSHATASYRYAIQ